MGSLPRPPWLGAAIAIAVAASSPAFAAGEDVLATLRGDDATREAAACRIASAGASSDDAPGIALALVALLKDGTTRARACAAAALATIAPAIASDAEIAERLREEAVPVLVLGLDQRGEMCRTAADALGALGPIAEEAVPRLEDALSRESCAKQSVHAETALQRIRTATGSAPAGGGGAPAKPPETI